MPELSSRAMHLVQLLAEELDKMAGEYAVLMTGDGRRGHNAWDWRVEAETLGEQETFESNAETNMADVIPIRRIPPPPARGHC